MRVFFLPKYIMGHELQPCVLKDCSVVIDGQNFLHNIYEESDIPFVFGCESDKFAALVKKRLDMFKEANVKCYFVFKGGDTNIGRKISIEKAQNDGELFDFIENKEFVQPLFMKEVYRQVLDEMGIPYALCEFESKRDCVALAMQLNCPVISNDIEFCFLEAPYIPYKYTMIPLIYNSKTKAIVCKQYKRANFLKTHSLTEQKLAIFAVLTDTNIFPDKFFDDLLLSFRALHRDYFVRYNRLWQWLSMREETAALDFIYSRLNQNDKDKFKSEFNRFKDSMQTKQQSYVADYLLNEGKLDFEQKDSMWFQKGIISKKIPITFSDLNSFNNLIVKGPIESNNSKFSLLLAIDIVKYAYNLLTDFKRDEFKIIVGPKHMEIDAKREAPAAIETPAFANGWNDIKEMGLFEIFLKENSIDVALISQVPSDAAMLIIALVYFARKKSSENIGVDREAYSVITCFVMLAGSRDVSTNDRDEAGKVAQAYFNVSTEVMRRIFDRELLHNFVEFQQCLQQLNYLNIMCGSPYEPTVYHKTYNGTFVYKLFHDMGHSGQDCATFLNNLFNGSTSVLNDINKLIGLYKKVL